MACNLANIVFPGQFNPKTDKWCEYKERLLCCLDVAGVNNDNLEKARSVFLSQCGKETYSLIVSLLVPKRPTEVAFKDILLVLDQFYEPELNEILQAGKFHLRKQTDKESVQDFIAAIGLLGVKANFADLKRQLRDRLVLGVRDERLRRELLKTKSLTYETAVQLCLNHQAIVEDIYPDTKVETRQTHLDVAEPMDIDSYSKWFEAEIIPSMSSETVITVCRKIFASQGLPDTIVSDNGRAFSSNEFNQFLQNNGIKHLYSPPYHPATNGQIERAIQTFKNKLRKLSSQQLAWVEKLPKVLYSLRTVPNSSNNKTPAEMLNGRKYRTAVSSLHPDNFTSAQEQQLDNRAQRSAGRKFTENQLVLVRNYGPGEKWKRAVIEMIEGPSSYMVRTEDGELQRRHANQILARRASQSVEMPVVTEHRSRSRSSSCSTEPPIEIPPPDLWPDIIGIPNTAD